MSRVEDAVSGFSVTAKVAFEIRIMGTVSLTLSTMAYVEQRPCIVLALALASHRIVTAS